MTSSPAASPTPVRIFQLLTAYQHTAALRGAIDLGLFTAIGKGANTVETLAAEVKASTKGVRVLADTLTVMGLLGKTGNTYQLTGESAAFLDQRSPAYLGSAARFLAGPQLMGYWSDLAATVRKGGSVASEGTVAPDDPIWIEFARSMAPMRAPGAEFIARLSGAERGEPWKVLDVASSHGLFGIHIAQANPRAKIVAVDWKNVLPVTMENAQKAGVAGRYTTIAGSVFDVELGSGYDVVLLPAFIHHFDISTNEKLLRKFHAALKPGGRVFTLEFIPNEDRVSPPETATFALIMLASTPSGDAYTYSEIETMFGNAGFSRSELHPIPDNPERVVISYK